VALGRLADLPRGQISGVALELLFMPLVEKTTTKRRLYGTGIREITRGALVLANKISIEEYEDYPIGLHWPKLLPVDSLEDLQIAEALERLGVSKDTLLQERNYDPDKEAEKRQQEAEQTVVNYSRGVGLPPSNQMMQAPEQMQPVGGKP